MVIHPKSAAYRIGRIDAKCGLTRNPFWRNKHSPSWEMWQAGFDSVQFNERYK